MPSRKARPTAPSKRLATDPTAQRGSQHPSPEVKEARLDQVEALLATGVTAHQIAEHCRVNYGIAARTARDYIFAIRERWVAESKAARPERIRQIERMLEQCHQAAMAASPPQIHAAIRAAVELARLAGAYRDLEAPDIREPDTHQHVHLHASAPANPQLSVIAMTPIEREAEIVRLEKKRQLSLLAKNPPRKPAAARLAAILEAGKEPR